MFLQYIKHSMAIMDLMGDGVERRCHAGDGRYSCHAQITSADFFVIDEGAGAPATQMM
jgi:hypothetical protein